MYQEDILWAEERLDRSLYDETVTIFDRIDEVRCEKDLLSVAQENLEQFKAFLPQTVTVDDISGNALEDILEVMHRLYTKIYY